MIRDPLAELWALRPRSGSSRSLTVPVKHPRTRAIVWLSAGQWMTLLYLRRRMRWGRGETTLAAIGAATDAHPGAVTHRLDRLAQLGLIGRYSTPGRGHRTRFWPPRGSGDPSRHAGDCRRHRHGSAAAASPGVNVATSTAFGGLIRAYVTRDGLQRAAARGGIPPDPPAGGPTASVRRRRPPRLIYERCPACGRRARLTAWRSRIDSARIVAVWDGTCPGCGAVIVAPLSIELHRERWAIPEPISAVLDVTPLAFAGDGRRHRRAAAPSIPPGPRLDRLRVLAAEIVAAGELDHDELAQLGARWLGWRPERIPHPAAVAGDPAERDALRATAWSTARDHRPVRYSHPDQGDQPTDSSVRDSQPTDDGPAGGA